MFQVLYIEDQPDIQKILKLTLLASKKFAVELASTGTDGLRLAMELKPDLILLDYTLPDIDGPAVIAALKQSEIKEVPVVFVTAMTQPEDMERCRALGAVDIITKPFSPRDLANHLLGILAAHGVNRSAQA